MIMDHDICSIMSLILINDNKFYHIQQSWSKKFDLMHLSRVKKDNVRPQIYSE